MNFFALSNLPQLCRDGMTRRVHRVPKVASLEFYTAVHDFPVFILCGLTDVDHAGRSLFTRCMIADNIVVVWVSKSIATMEYCAALVRPHGQRLPSSHHPHLETIQASPPSSSERIQRTNVLDASVHKNLNFSV